LIGSSCLLLPFGRIRIHQVDRLTGHDRRDRMLVHKLRMSVTPKQDAKIIEPGDDALQLDAVDEKYGQGRLIFTNVIEKSVLQTLHTLGSHDGPHFFLFLDRGFDGSRRMEPSKRTRIDRALPICARSSDTM
jgi:hypothetical protein